MAAKEYGELIGFLLARLDARDELIAQLREELGRSITQIDPPQPLTEHPSTTGPSRPLTGE